MHLKDSFILIGMLATLLALVVPVLHTSSHSGVSAESTTAEYAPLELSNAQTLDNSSGSSIDAAEDKVLEARDNPYNEAWWAEIQAAGQCLLTSLSVKSIPESIFLKYSDISASGWQGGKVALGLPPDPPLSDIMKENGWHWFNFQKIEHELPTYSETGRKLLVKYTIFVNSFAGVIVATGVFGPKGGPGDPPKLKRLSDYMFLVYQKSCTNARHVMDECLGGIEWVIYLSITNTASQQASRWAAQGNGNPFTYPGWLGTVYSMKDARGAGMLASPIGIGAAYLCGQHKTQMGQKIPVTVQAFRTLVSSNLNFAYRLQDYDPGTLSNP